MVNKSKSLSVGRQKLNRLGITLPPLAMTSAGSLPKNPELNELRYKISKGLLMGPDLERRERLSVEGWLREQTRLGFDVFVDGEITRGDMIVDTAKRIEGFETSGTVRIYANKYYQKPVIRGKLQWKEPLIFPHWQFAQRLSNRPVKAVLPGPFTLMDWSFNEYYKTRADVLADLIPIYKREVASLIDAGAKIIQFDEPALSSRAEDFPLLSGALKQIIQPDRAYIILRHIFGDLSAFWPKLERLPIDNIYVEGANSNFRVLKDLKRFGTKKDVTIGFIDAHNPAIEPPSLIEKNLKEALKTIPPTQLWAGTDDGLKILPMDIATTKLTNLATAVKKIRRTTH